MKIYFAFTLVTHNTVLSTVVSTSETLACLLHTHCTILYRYGVRGTVSVRSDAPPPIMDQSETYT